MLNDYQTQYGPYECPLTLSPIRHACRFMLEDGSPGVGWFEYSSVIRVPQIVDPITHVPQTVHPLTRETVASVDFVSSEVKEFQDVIDTLLLSLQQAVINNDIDEIILWLSKGGKPEIILLNGCSLLHYAAFYRRNEIVALLVGTDGQFNDLCCQEMDSIDSKCFHLIAAFGGLKFISDRINKFLINLRLDVADVELQDYLASIRQILNKLVHSNTFKKNGFIEDLLNGLLDTQDKYMALSAKHAFFNSEESMHALINHRFYHLCSVILDCNAELDCQKLTRYQMSLLQYTVNMYRLYYKMKRSAGLKSSIMFLSVVGMVCGVVFIFSNFNLFSSKMEQILSTKISDTWVVVCGIVLSALGPLISMLVVLQVIITLGWLTTKCALSAESRAVRYKMRELLKDENMADIKKLLDTNKSFVAEAKEIEEVFNLRSSRIEFFEDEIKTLVEPGHAVLSRPITYVFDKFESNANACAKDLESPTETIARPILARYGV